MAALAGLTLVFVVTFLWSRRRALAELEQVEAFRALLGAVGPTFRHVAVETESGGRAGQLRSG